VTILVSSGLMIFQACFSPFAMDDPGIVSPAPCFIEEDLNASISNLEEKERVFEYGISMGPLFKANLSIERLLSFLLGVSPLSPESPVLRC